MREGYSENNSGNPDDSTTEADDNFEIVFAAIEEVLLEIKNGHERTYDEQFQDLIIATGVFRAAEQLRVNEWTPRLAAVRELLVNTGIVMEHEGMPNFARWFMAQVDEIDTIFAHESVQHTEHRSMDVSVERSNSNHLLDWPLP